MSGSTLNLGLPIACAGVIEVGNHIHLGGSKFEVIAAHGAMFEIREIRETCPVMLCGHRCELDADPTHSLGHRQHVTRIDGQEVRWTVSELVTS